jgi:hypothetical protein
MALAGYLSEFSLPEIFQFLEQGYKSGLLSIQPEPDANKPDLKAYYLWLDRGRIVAVANQLDNEGLVSMINQRGWLKPQVKELVYGQCAVDQPMGMCLKTQGVISAEQLKLLFHAQVLQRVCGLFKLQNAYFAFDPTAKLPKAEMTGLSLSTSEANLLGLRVLRDWTTLAPKLPDPTCGLTKVSAGKPHLQLDSQEWQVWEFADGSVSIEAIARQLQLPVEKLQQIAFRMSVVGLVEELPITAPEPKKEPVVETMPELAVASTNDTSINRSFLQNLVGFLRSKV